MGIQNPEQCRPEVSSLIHPEPDPGANSGGADDKSGDAGSPSPVDDDGKSIVMIVQTCSSTLAGQCLEFESETRMSASEASSSSNYDLLYEKIESLQRVDCDKPKRRRSKKNKRNLCGSCNRKCCGKYSPGRQACYYAASFVADCAAICCCPCAILHIFVLAFVKAPSVYARKAFCYAKRKARSIQGKKDHKKNSNDDEEEDVDDENRRSSWYYTPPWSCRESPQSGVPPLDGSRCLKFDTEKLWAELYAAGHMGFGGLPCERD